MTSTELHDFLRSRRSVRRFTIETLDNDVLRRIVETAGRAPSAHNRQPWRFAIVTRMATKVRLADAMAAEFARDLAADGLDEVKIAAQVDRSNKRIGSAPAVIVLCMEMTDMDSYPDGRRQDAERIMAIQSTALAGLQLLLAAHAEGIAGVWVCAPLFAPGNVRSTLDLPPTWEPQAMLLLGYSSESPRPKEILPIERIARFE